MQLLAIFVRLCKIHEHGAFSQSRSEFHYYACPIAIVVITEISVYKINYSFEP